MGFIQKVADGAKQLGTQAKDLGGIAGDKARDISKKSSELFELTKLKREMQKMETEIANNLAGIGALYYQQQQAGQVDASVGEELTRLLNDTKELEMQMKELETQIEDMQPETPACADCGKELPAGGKFCSFCAKQVVE